jgi:hypothetical protein
MRKKLKVGDHLGLAQVVKIEISSHPSHHCGGEWELLFFDTGEKIRQCQKCGLRRSC